MNTAYLCLGGNIGDREKNLCEAMAMISALAGEISLQSALYETEAWGVDEQAAYLNCCILVRTKLQADALMSTLLSIEKTLGRTRQGLQYASRTVDIDILFFNDAVVTSENITIPHPRMHLRRFVLVPLAEIAPAQIHPLFDQTVEELLRECTDDCQVNLLKKAPCISA